MSILNVDFVALSKLAEAHWPALVTLAGLGYALYRVISFAKSDADSTTLAAFKRLPQDAFKGKVVLLVGASSGIGEALALELAQRGATLILGARRVDRLVDVSRRCMEAGAPDAMAQKLDVTDYGSHAAVVESIIRKYRRIDVLVNNAGASQRGLAERTPLAVDVEMFQLNVFGVMSVTKAVLPHMLAAGSGMIVTTSSVAGKTGSPISSTYSATKHALNGFFDSLGMEVGYRGVDVVNVCPGPVLSEITLRAFTEEKGRQLGQQAEDAVHRLTAQRCGELMAAAMWARLPESWIAPQPILFYTYVRQYAPSLFFRLGKSAGQKRVEAFLGGHTGYGALSNPLAVLFGGGSKQAATPSQKQD